MPQELRVVRCFQCLKFQVDIVKKVNKWACKVCGVKQSLMREFVRGTGKECRAVVQELTARNIATDEQEAEIAEVVLQNDILPPKPATSPRTQAFSNGPFSSNSSHQTNVSNKWDSFLRVRTDEDYSDCLELETALAQVSSTSFNRERVNVLTREHGGKSGISCTHFSQTGDDVGIDYCFDKSSMPYVPSRILSKTIDDCAISRNHNIVFRQGNSIQGPDSNGQKTPANNSNISALPSSRLLTDFHKKLPTCKVQKRDSFIPRSTKTVTDETNAICRKRKQSDLQAAPLMSFGNRGGNESSIVPPTTENDVMFDCVSEETYLENTSTASSSKWTKFLMRKEESIENNEDAWLPF